MNLNDFKDPLKFAKVMWPEVKFYSKQREVIYAVPESAEVFVPAGNMLGKDFVAGFISLWFFLTHHPVRVITTSVKDDHLRVLWGEIGRFVTTCKYPLLAKEGGPLIFNHREMNKVVKGKVDRISYMIGMVSERGEGMAGHHAEHTLGVIDEASGVDDTVYTQMGTWAKHILVLGNPNTPAPGCTFFYKGVKAGDLLAS